MRTAGLFISMCVAAVGQNSSLFEQGHFAEASEAAAADHSFAAELLKAKAALWSNDRATAQRHLDAARKLQPDSKDAALLQAQLFVRQDQFVKAGEAYRSASALSSAELMDLFADRAPYRVEGTNDRIDITFDRVDPLPYFKASVNGKEAWLLLDTGSHELVLDPEFAESAAVPTTKTGSTREFAGGNKAETRYGVADRLQLSDWIIHDVPVSLLPLKRMSAAARGKRVDGILGTALLYHFLPTIDYAGAKLTLRKTHSAAAEAFHAKLKSSQSFPFWLAGTHYIVSWGKINGQGPMLFFLDTGLAGPAFTGPKETLERAGIPLPGAMKDGGIGGGSGTVTSGPIQIAELEFAGLDQKDILGLYGPFPPRLRMQLGFEIAGIVSHAYFTGKALTLDFETMRGYVTD